MVVATELISGWRLHLINRPGLAVQERLQLQIEVRVDGRQEPRAAVHQRAWLGHVDRLSVGIARDDSARRNGS